MTLDLLHLTTPTRELAFQDAKARIRLVQTARWVAHPRAGVAVDELERRFNYPTCARMPCMLLYGDSGMGKSMILEKMERQHQSSYDQRRGITKRPIVIVQMPSSPDQRRFYTRGSPGTGSALLRPRGTRRVGSPSHRSSAKGRGATPVHRGSTVVTASSANRSIC
jgi:hypothetical protein